MDARSLVLWIGDHHGAILKVPGQDVVGSVAMRLPNVGRNTASLHNARRTLGLGVALDTECWRNQGRPDHVLRGSAFRQLGYDVRDLFQRERLDIERPLSAGQTSAYAEAHLEAQIASDPTIFQCPGHVYESTAGLENEIALAEATLDLVDSRALREPADGDPHDRRRSVFATICVRPGQLSGDRLRALVDRYVRLSVDGYWVWAVGFKAGAAQTEILLRLALALQEDSGRPACPGGLKHLWQAALARGVAAAVTGPDRGTLEFDPNQKPPPPRDPEDDDANRRRIHGYHGAVLGCFKFDEHGEKAERSTYLRNPCGCGHHEARVPPNGRKETTGHNQWWRLTEARLLCAGSASEASVTLAERLRMVREERLAVGQGRLPAGWRRAIEPWAEVPVGWGAADGRQA